MKLNKFIVGFGALALMLSSCDKAAEQDYTPGEPVNVPPAYFPLDYDGQVVLDEFQTEFNVPVYRGTKDGSATVEVKASVNGDFFSYKLGDAPAVPFQVGNSNQAIADIPVHFENGQDVADITITYDWDTMEAHKGIIYTFTFLTPGETTDFFQNSSEYTALYVPWEPVIGPGGETSAVWSDDALFTGFSVTGADPIWDVDMQMNPLTPGLFRVLNPFAGAPQNSSGEDFRYHGTEDVWMYINATDPENVYLCDKIGKPKPKFETMYTLSSAYGNITYWDRAAGELIDEQCDEDSPNGGYGHGIYRTMTVAGVNYPDYIDFKEGHFYVLFGDYADPSSGPLTITFPGGNGKQDWADMGMGTYTEGLLTRFYGMDVAEIQVPVQRHTEELGKYRMVDPYTTYWVEENPQEEAYNIEIDATNPDFVLIEYQETGNYVESKGKMTDAYISNYGYYMTQYVPEKTRLTEDQVKEQGKNDTMKDNTINLANALIFYNKSQNVISIDEVGGDGNKLVLPTEAAGAPRYATAAAANHAKGLRYSNGVRALKIKRAKF